MIRFGWWKGKTVYSTVAPSPECFIDLCLAIGIYCMRRIFGCILHEQNPCCTVALRNFGRKMLMIYPKHKSNTQELLHNKTLHQDRLILHVLFVPLAEFSWREKVLQIEVSRLSTPLCSSLSFALQLESTRSPVSRKAPTRRPFSAPLFSTWHFVLQNTRC